MEHPWMDTLEKVYLDELVKLYHTENKLAETLSRNRERTLHDGLKQILGSHLDRAGSHSGQIKKILEGHNVDLQSLRDDFADLLIAESENTEKLAFYGGERWLQDAILIASAHKIQHYQIAAYKTMTCYAGILGYDVDRRVLHDIQCEKEFDDCKLHGHVQCALGGPTDPWTPPDK